MPTTDPCYANSSAKLVVHRATPQCLMAQVENVWYWMWVVVVWVVNMTDADRRIATLVTEAPHHTWIWLLEYWAQSVSFHGFRIVDRLLTRCLYTVGMMEPVFISQPTRTPLFLNPSSNMILRPDYAFMRDLVIAEAWHLKSRLSILLARSYWTATVPYVVVWVYLADSYYETPGS